MAICTQWPVLDPETVSRWPWYRTRFYAEWLTEIAKNVDDEGGGRTESTNLAELPAPEAAAAFRGLGITVREVS